MSNVTVTILSGTSETEVELIEGNVQSLLSHPQIEALGLGDNVDVKSGGAVLSPYSPLTNGQFVEFTQRKSGKGNQK